VLEAAGRRDAAIDAWREARDRYAARGSSRSRAASAKDSQRLNRRKPENA
jgi:hypothetical protein